MHWEMSADDEAGAATGQTTATRHGTGTVVLYYALAYWLCVALLES